MTQRYLYLCESCVPSGCRTEEYPTRPLLQKCEVCGNPAERWIVNRDRMLVELIRFINGLSNTSTGDSNG